jgi:glycine/D-amino acid oxidase-like deaminating enzyme
MPVDSLSLFEETSFWARSYGLYQPEPPLVGDSVVDVAIIGAGYTGLSTALEFLRDNPAARVAVLEAAVVGYGASGRNGGFNMKLFGMEPEVTKLRWGAQRTVEAHRYAQQAVAFTRKLIENHRLDSDYRHTGMLRVSYSEAQVRRLRSTYRLMQELGIDDDLSLWSREQLAAEFQTERYAAAIGETETGILNPCKHVRELKRLAKEVGATIHERTPVLKVERIDGGVRLQVPNGSVRAGRLVVATNAYSIALQGLPTLRARQIPIWTFQVVTAPLTPTQWASIGWRDQQSFEDNRQLVHYFRPTVDGRITMGGGAVTAHAGIDLDHDFAPGIWRHCEEHLRWLFPQLSDVPIDYRWGGPVSVNIDMTPEIGMIGDERVIFSTGCIGHGVSLTHLNGRLIADLLGDRKTPLTDFWIVNRTAVRWPPEPLRFMLREAIIRVLKAWDFLEERSLH